MNLLKLEMSSSVATIILNRPEIHNAFNDKLIDELTKTFIELDQNDEVKLVVLTGAGKSFCAGADLNWMSSMIDYSMDENIADSMKLATLFETVNNFSKPVIGKINGAALGGGVGLVCVCDYAISIDKAKFGFTETRLGLVPAVISPYCINKIGESNARAWFLSGERFSAHKAKEMNLLHEITSVESFENRVQEVVNSFLKAGPLAMKEAKSLIKNVLKRPNLNEYTTQTIARLRITEEGQEGMKALLEKRKAKWMEDEN